MHGSDPSRSRSSRAKLGVTSPDAPFGGRRLANREIFIIINTATNRWGPIKVSLSIFQPFAGRDRGSNNQWPAEHRYMRMEGEGETRSEKYGDKESA